MKIFSFNFTSYQQFASFITQGTWSKETVCPACGSVSRKRSQPLIVEWEPDSDLIGDFVWSLYDMAIQERVVKAIQKFHGMAPEPLQMIQDPKLKRPTRITKRTKPRIWLPYEGPPLFDCWITAWAHIDMRLSSVRLVKECNVCGKKVYETNGIENWKWRWDPELKKLIDIHNPRVPDQGVFVKRAELKGADIFRVYELPGFVVCTEPVKDLIEKEGFTNVRFDEMGDIVE